MGRKRERRERERLDSENHVSYTPKKKWLTSSKKILIAIALIAVNNYWCKALLYQIRHN